MPSLFSTRPRASSAVFTLGILSSIAIAVWIFVSFNLPSAVGTAENIISVQISRTEVLLLLVLVFLNILTAYAIFRKIQPRLAPIRASIGIIILTFLILVIWILQLILKERGFLIGSEGLSAEVQRFEVLLVLVLVFANLFALLMVLRKFQTAETFVTLSAYSKKVKYKGEWIPLEQWLSNEFGIQVSHGITPEEREQVLAGVDVKNPNAGSQREGRWAE